MSLAAVVGVLVVAALVASLGLAARGDRGTGTPARRRAAFALRLTAVAVTVVVAVLITPWAWRDSGAFMFALVGIPMTCALMVLGVSLTRRPTRLATWTAAAVMLTWSLLTSLGPGAYFLGPSVLMTAAALASSRDPAAKS